MADETPRLPEDDIPQAVPRRPGPRSLQLVWIIPIVAALIGGWILAKSFWEQGPTITIQFRSAEGIEAGKTRIKHKAVDIGVVQSIELSEDRKSVVVTAEVNRKAARGFLVEDTRFWVVRPRIAGGEVSGLSTLLAGSYIGGDPGKSSEERRHFVGLEVPPVITSDLPGRQYTLVGEDLGRLDINSPVYYRGLVAGRVVSSEIAPDGKSVHIGLFINAPYDRYVTADTRFWNASGVDVTLDASGLKLETQSLVSVLMGGIAFAAPPESPEQAPIEAGARFPLWETKAIAFKPRETVIETYVMRFPQSVRGLAVGAPVDFRGITVGEVRRIDLEFDPQAVRYRSAVVLHLYPERLRPRNRRPGGRFEQMTPQQRLERFVERGFRGQLRSANLLTGQLYVAVDFFDKAPKAQLRTDTTPPEIPTIAAGGLGELQESLGRIVQNLEKVPFDAIARDVRTALADLSVTLKGVDATLKRFEGQLTPELKATLEQARKTLQAGEQMMSSDSPMSGDLRETLHEVTRAAESVRELTDYLERHPESLLRGRRGEDRK